MYLYVPVCTTTYWALNVCFLLHTLDQKYVPSTYFGVRKWNVPAALTITALQVSTLILSQAWVLFSACMLFKLEYPLYIPHINIVYTSYIPSTYQYIATWLRYTRYILGDLYAISICLVCWWFVCNSYMLSMYLVYHNLIGIYMVYTRHIHGIIKVYHNLSDISGTSWCDYRWLFSVPV
jgi:hypothetical protein